MKLEDVIVSFGFSIMMVCYRMILIELGSL